VFLKSSFALNAPKTKITTEFPDETKENKTYHYGGRVAIVKEFQCIQIHKSAILLECFLKLPALRIGTLRSPQSDRISQAQVGATLMIKIVIGQIPFNINNMKKISNVFS
jgi:hypothetical protein